MELLPTESLFLEVSAMYDVTYSPKRHCHRNEVAGAASASGRANEQGTACGEAERGDGLSFVWGIIGDFLLALKTKRVKQREGRGGCPKAYLEAPLRDAMSR